MLLAASTMLQGCATHRAPVAAVDPATIASSTEARWHSDEKLTRFTGPNSSTQHGDVLLLRAWKSDGWSAPRFQIYGAAVVREPLKFYAKAYDADGTTLAFQSLHRGVEACTKDGCRKMEHFGIDVPRAYLESLDARGITFTVSGAAGVTTFHLPPGYVRGFLAKFDECLSRCT